MRFHAFIDSVRARMSVGKWIVTFVDYAAMFVAFVFLTCLAATTIFHSMFSAVLGAIHTIEDMYRNQEDRVVLIVVAVSCLWCAVRWKALNRRPR